MFLVFARMLSGVGEASFQCTIPPFITNNARPGSKGMWLSIFFTAIPVGTAIGYVYSANVATTLGWQYCFFIEGILMTPFVWYMFYISPHFPPPNRPSHGDTTKPAVSRKPSVSSNISHTSSLQVPDPTNEIMMLNKINSHLEEYERGEVYEGELHDQVYEPLISVTATSASGSFSPLPLSITPPPAGNNTNASAGTVSPIRYRRVSSNMALLPELAPESSEDEGQELEVVPTVYEELHVVLTTPIYICMVLGYAAQTATLIGMCIYMITIIYFILPSPRNIYLWFCISYGFGIFQHGGSGVCSVWGCCQYRYLIWV